MADSRQRKADSKQHRDGVFPSLSLLLTAYSPRAGTVLLPTPRFDPGLLVATLLALFTILPLLTHPGLPNTADGPVHLMRQAELNQAWQDGILYPRWAPDLAYGYGMPLFHYAPPLLYHATQLVHLSGLPLDASMKGTLILMMLLYSLGTYLFARDLFGPRAGLLAAAVYLYAPYRLREAYIQGNYGQFCGLAFYPLILWSFHGLITTHRRRYLPLAALSLAGLLLSHNISAMIFAPLLAMYVVFLLVWRGLASRETGDSEDQEIRKSESQETNPPDSPSPNPPIPGSLTPDSPIPKIIAAIALSLGLSAFFWLPAFGERDLIRLAGITSGFFDFRHNFISLAELLALPRPLDVSSINPYYPLSLGLAQIAFAVLALLGIGLYYVLRFTHYVSPAANGGRLIRGHHGAQSNAVAHMLFFSAALLVAALLALPYSQPIWEAVPLLELAEFPWRWLGPAVLCAAVLAGGAFFVFEELAARHWGLKTRITALAASLFFALAANLFYLYPAQFIPWGTPSPADVVAYEARSGAIGTTSTGEFLPRWADRYPSPEILGADYAAGRLPNKLDPASLPPGGSAATLAYTARETRLAVSSPVPFVATFRALYWPDWRVRVAEGSEGDEYQVTDLQIAQPGGLIRAQLPAGEYLVSLRLFSTPIRKVATVISILALALFLAPIGWQLAGWKTGRWEDPYLSSLPTFQPANLPSFQALLIGTALAAGLLVSRPLADWFRVQSPLDSVYGAQHTLRADFGDQVRLLAFDLPPRRGLTILPSFHPSKLPAAHAQAGGTLPVVLYWRSLAPLATDYSVFVHLDAPDGRTYASVDELNPADIPTSNWPPSLYVRNPLTLELPAELPPIRYTLTAGLYDDESGDRLPVTSCEGCPPGENVGDALPLAHVWLSSPAALDERDVPHRLDYRLGEQITLLGYDLVATDPATLTLYWRADGSVESGYTIFIHALDDNGELIVGFDAPPLRGLYPTDAWLPGQVIADSYTLTLPGSTQALLVGMYDPVSLARLPVTDRSGGRVPDDAIRLVAGNR